MALRAQVEALKKYAVFNQGELSPVKSKQPIIQYKQTGVYDMIGNVDEWVLDAYQDYKLPTSLTQQLNATKHTKNQPVGALRVIRGGFFDATMAASGCGLPFVSGTLPDHWVRAPWIPLCCCVPRS